jgi:hypothetical protein
MLYNMSYIKYKMLLLCLMLTVNILVAQDIDNTYSITVSGQAGVIMAHKDDMEHIARSRPVGFQADFAVQTNGKQMWHHAYNFPVVGVSVGYFNMNAPQLLGKTMALIGYMEPVIYRSSRHRISYRIGTGLAYNTRPFNLTSNYSNIAISSPLSFTLQASLNYTYCLNKLYYLSAALNLIHYSNGAMKMPNTGINILAVSLGIGYKFKEDKEKPERMELAPVNKKLSFEIIGAGGLIENYPVGGKKYAAWTISAYSSQRISRKSAINIGIDGFYNLALREFIDKRPYFNGLDFRRIGLVVGHELIISRLSLLTQAGYYLYMPSKVHNKFYQRYGLRYKLYQNYFGSIMLKSHLGRAELVEWGIGVKI